VPVVLVAKAGYGPAPVVEVTKVSVRRRCRRRDRRGASDQDGAATDAEDPPSTSTIAAVAQINRRDEPLSLEVAAERRNKHGQIPRERDSGG
jgi:hypothetical protein